MLYIPFVSLAFDLLVSRLTGIILRLTEGTGDILGWDRGSLEQTRNQPSVGL